jgi:hypothetical protein
MCTGAEIGMASLGAQALGALSGANAAQNNATSNQIQLNFQADMAKINARLNESNAQATLLAGQRQEQNIGLKAASMKSAQTTHMAAGNIDLGSQTALNILTTTDVMSEIDRETAASNAVRSAWGYRTNAANNEAEAAMKRASAAGINPSDAYTASLLGSAATVAGSWYAQSKGLGWGSTGKATV